MSDKQIVATELEIKVFSHTNKPKEFSPIDNVLTALDFVFGCWHRNVSRPFTLSGWTYEVCLNCGKKFANNRAEIGYRRPRISQVPALGLEDRLHHGKNSDIAFQSIGLISSRLELPE